MIERNIGRLKDSSFVSVIVVGSYVLVNKKEKKKKNRKIKMRDREKKRLNCNNLNRKIEKKIEKVFSFPENRKKIEIYLK